MNFDTAAADRSAFARPFDVCVIGAGPAGITLARRLADAGADVALMEAGALEITAESQAIYEGETTGLDYYPLDVARLRFFGGTSNHWGGWCRALDAYDFGPKPFNPLSGWPIGRIELDPYRAEADAILDLPPESLATDLPFKQDGYDFRRFRFRWSAPTLFAEKYGPEIEASPRIHLGLNANLVDLRLDDRLGAVTIARFRSLAPDDPGFEVQARIFCLCTGGIENARLLLNFRGQAPEGIGNRNDLVGRYFCEHPSFQIADVLLPGEPLPEMEFYCPSEQFIHSRRVLNFGLRFEPGPWPPTMPASAARLRLTDPFELRLLEFMRAEEHPPRRAVAAEHLPLASTATLRTAHEQALDPESRVRLGADSDALGLARPVLDWRLGELDIHTMRTAATAFGRHLAAENRGRVRLREWLFTDPVVFPDIASDEVAGQHHMGTTRMADDPRHGVVDRDCRVHGMDNLFIAGSSVFATPGHANPTYTITQLSLRLGDHLTTRLAG